MNPPVYAIAEKLNRAKEHIEQLRAEVSAFLNEAPHRELVNYDASAAQAFRDFHQARHIPARFSIIAGEAIHQLRSSLDHLVSALIIADEGAPTVDSQFPICRFEPTKDKQIRRYKRQVEGITRP